MRFVSLLMLLALVPGAAVAEWVSDERAIMGTSVRVELWHPDPAAGSRALEAVMAEMQRIDATMSTYKKDSEISRVNREAAAQPIAVSREMLELVRRSLELSTLTGGAFDITYASVGYMYDYRAGTRPDQAAIDTALAAVDYRLVRLDEESGTIGFGRDGVRIDLGGIAKGYATERGAAILMSHGVEHAIVTAGGDSRIVGDRLGKPWIVGVRHPRDRQQVIVRMPLENEAISTSGDYERYFEEDGVRYHHIIRPSTGKSPGEVYSATIIGPDATMTDGLSTSVFVLGPEDGMALIERLEGYEGVIVDRDGRIHHSSGLTPPE